MKKIVVTGSLGNLGKPLTRLLVEKGHTVTVVSSSADRSKDIESLGAKPAIGSVKDVEFLTATFKGNDAVFLLHPPSHTASNFQQNYVDSAKAYSEAVAKSGVKRVVDLSSVGGHDDKGFGLLNIQKQIEDFYNNLSGITVTHLRPVYFYSNLFRFVGLIKSKGIIVANYGANDRIPLVHANDIAEAAVEELESKSTTNIKVRYVISDERTCDEIATALGQAISKPDLKWIRCTDDQSLQSMKQLGFNDLNAGFYNDMGAAMRTGKLYEDLDTVKPAHAHVKLEEFAKEFATFYNNPSSTSH